MHTGDGLIYSYDQVNIILSLNFRVKVLYNGDYLVTPYLHIVHTYVATYIMIHKKFP